MKTNLKTKVMLAVLAGGMLCANGAFATNYFYNTSSNQWTTSSSSTATSGLTLTIDDSTTFGGNNVVSLVENDVIYVGYSSGSGTVFNNTITFDTTDASTIKANIHGGHSQSGAAGSETDGDNKVIIKGGTFSGSISGGYSNSDSAENNSVTINGGTINASVYGGYSFSDSAKGNIVTINNGGTINGSIYGGHGLSATENIVVINGGTFNNGFSLYGGDGSTSTGNALSLWTVIGGKAKEVKKFQMMNFTIPKGMDTEMPMLKVTTPVVLHDATNGDIGFTTNPNDLDLAEGDYVTLVKGVDNTNFTPATNYKVFDFGTYKELVYGNNPVAKADFEITTNGEKSKVNDTYYNDGASTTDKIANTNKEYGSKVQGNVNFADGTATTNYTGNEIIIRRGTYSEDVYGAQSANSDSVTNNKVSIYDGTFSYNEIFGGYSKSGTAENNTVTINGGTFAGTIYGGGSEAGAVSHNEVIVNNLTTDESFTAYGGYRFELGGNDNANVSYNTIQMNSDNNAEISGGVSLQGGYINGYAVGSVSHNTVNVKGYKFSSDSGVGITGGYTMAAGFNASDNTVDIRNCVFATSGSVSIYGGNSGQGDACNNVVKITDCVIDSTSEFEVYGGATGFTSNSNNNTVELSGNISGTGKISVLSGAGMMAATITGNTLNLKTKLGVPVGNVKFFETMNFTLPAGIKNDDIMLTTGSINYGSNAKVNVTAADGVSLKKDDKIYLVKADSKSGEVDLTNSIALGGAGEISLVNNDLILTLLRDFEQKSGGGADQQKAPAEGVAAAAAMVNVSADLASGEGMDSMLAETAGGETNTFGAVSAGRSKFKTGSHVDVDGWGVVVGAGKTKEWTNGSATTMGIFLEYGKGDFDTYNGVFHGDGDTKNHGVGVMARHKTANNNYYEGNIRYGRQETSWGQSEIGGYETDSRYYGVMVGMGHIIQLGKNELDVYGRYSYGHVGACNAKVGNNDYRFDSVKSHRVRVGGKYNFVRANSKAKPFVGVAWEHEFNGESKATIAGVGQAPAPGLKGNTGIIQAGCDWDLGKKWTAGAGANAYVGKRKGWDGMLRAFYSF